MFDSGGNFECGFNHLYAASSRNVSRMMFCYASLRGAAWAFLKRMSFDIFSEGSALITNGFVPA